MKKLALLWLTISGSLFSQPVQLDMKIFADRRQMFMENMDSNSVAVFPSKPKYMRNLDVEYEYRQESNFYYLSGFEEPQSVLLLSRSHPKFKYIMVVRRHDPRRETVEGMRTGVEGAIKEFRADTAFVEDDMDKAIVLAARGVQKVYYTFGINPEIDKKIAAMFVESRSSTNIPIVDAAPLINDMRVIKKDGDWAMGLQRAVDITVEGHVEAMKSVKPGMYEYELQAVHEKIYRGRGSPRNAYPCIVGSGPNGTILHYSKNARRMNIGELVLMDCAAEYGYYAADITRTVPVSGKFSKEQRTIYNIVLAAQNAAMGLVKPGVPMKDLTSIIDSVLGRGLLRLGFIKNAKDFRIFSLHGYSHWIGLDVHDVGSYTLNGESRRLEEGMVFTIEPGIYVRPDVVDKMKERGYTDEEIASVKKYIEPYMNMGVRIEDDVLVTKTGYKNLSAGVPRESDDIERLMSK